METFEADCVFEELVKIERGDRAFNFFLEASFDTEKVEKFRKIDKKTDFFDKRYFCFMKTQVRVLTVSYDIMNLSLVLGC